MDKRDIKNGFRALVLFVVLMAVLLVFYDVRVVHREYFREISSDALCKIVVRCPIGAWTGSGTIVKYENAGGVNSLITMSTAGHCVAKELLGSSDFIMVVYTKSGRQFYLDKNTCKILDPEYDSLDHAYVQFVSIWTPESVPSYGTADAGDDVFSYGCSDGRKFPCAKGYVYQIESISEMVCDIHVHFGASGSGLFNSKGELVALCYKGDASIKMFPMVFSNVCFVPYDYINAMKHTTRR